MEEIVLKTDFPDIPLFKRGKVRDIYASGELLLVIATDRISAFDCILPTGIPGKGKILTELCNFWFKFTKAIIPNHLISTDVGAILGGRVRGPDLPSRVSLQKYNSILEGRSMVVKKADVIPVECIVRGWLSGSGWKEYKKKHSICGINLPEGLTESSKLSEPIFTPTTKAEEGHDKPLSQAGFEDRVGREVAAFLKTKSIEIYELASTYALKKGILIADTKFEFGKTENGVILVDELLTPDSSRFWAVSDYKPGEPQKSFDKQFVRDYLETLGWNKQPPAPELPPHIVKKTKEKYLEAKNRLL